MDRLQLKAAGQSEVSWVLLTGQKRLARALGAIDSEYRCWVALSEREEAKVDDHRVFTFELPPDFVVQSPSTLTFRGTLSATYPAPPLLQEVQNSKGLIGGRPLSSMRQFARADLGLAQEADCQTDSIHIQDTRNRAFYLGAVFG